MSRGHIFLRLSENFLQICVVSRQTKVAHPDEAKLAQVKILVQTLLLEKECDSRAVLKYCDVGLLFGLYDDADEVYVKKGSTLLIALFLRYLTQFSSFAQPRQVKVTSEQLDLAKVIKSPLPQLLKELDFTLWHHFAFTPLPAHLHGLNIHRVKLVITFGILFLRLFFNEWIL